MRARPKPASRAEETRILSVSLVRDVPLPRPRVAAYVIRRLDDGIQLLVFDHEGIPGVGTQVPAGGIRPAESRREAALREIKRQTGLGAVRAVTELGIIESPDASGQPRQTSYWVLEAVQELPSQWRHVVAMDDADVEDDGLVFLCRWESLPLGFALLDGQGSLLGQLPRLFG